MRTATILRRVALAAGYAVMPLLLTDVLHQPPSLPSDIVLCGYGVLALCLAVERRPWLNALHASFFFLFVFLLSFLSAENFSMSPGEFCRFVLSPPEEYVSTTDIREFLAALVLLFPVVLGLFACWYAATASCARWMRRRIHGDVQRQADT
ncbi:MAG TPA: hypothetical protein H9774_06970 [Candidatus Desulfovibrio gallistercoris]|nr:hypothetical protein [Candidatus Desulfovibrio gallistercoris]